jgi:hypothetical protein
VATAHLKRMLSYVHSRRQVYFYCYHMIITTRANSAESIDIQWTCIPPICPSPYVISETVNRFKLNSALKEKMSANLTFHQDQQFRSNIQGNTRAIIIRCAIIFATVDLSMALQTFVGLLGRGTIPSQGRYLHIEQHKHRINAHKHS